VKRAIILQTEATRSKNAVLLDFLAKATEEANTYHTSKWCVRCGAVNAGHAKGNYALYGCGCGLNVNSDRKASLAVAVKTFLERDGSLDQETFQISGRRVPVSGLKRNVSDAVEPMVVLIGGSAKGKAHEFIRG